MLKIKDNIDLKELEKYGFRKSSIYSLASNEFGESQAILELLDIYLGILKEVNK